MARESPQDIRERVEELVYECEREGLSAFTSLHRGHMRPQFDADLIAHEMPCSKRKADRVAKILAKRYDAEEYYDG